MIHIYRLANLLYRWHVPFLPKILRNINRIIFSVVLPASTVVGKNVIFGYQGLAIVVHPRARIGDRVIIGPNVTIGGRSGHYDVPVIGNDVLIGAGARILGPVSIGDGAEIGANSVVVKDVPTNAVVVGIPAKIIKFKIKGE